jgi:NADH-quinone oxidoreductase subunit M
VKEFMICLLVMESAMIGVFCALDAILFFVFWEAMLIPMALLIGVWGGPRRLYAAQVLHLHHGGLGLPAGGAHRAAAEDRQLRIWGMMGQQFSPVFQFWVFAAFFLSFAIKVPMFPFHTWLPAAHVEAPTAGSVILASVLLKMGTYGFLRFCLPITPHAALTLRAVSAGLSVVGILYGGLTALAQNDLKKLVAYSSVGSHGLRHARHLRSTRRASRARCW